MQPDDKQGRGHPTERAVIAKDTSAPTSWRNWLAGLLAELTPFWMRKKR